MALFGSKSEAAEETKVIRPKVVQTENVAKELIIFAAAQQANISDLDFNLLEMHTFTRNTKNSSKPTWQESEDTHLAFKDESVLVDKSFEIKQSYEIEMIGAEPDFVFDKFYCSIASNGTVSRVYLTIKEGSYLEYCENFERLFHEFLNKKKIRANILAGVFYYEQKKLL